MFIEGCLFKWKTFSDSRDCLLDGHWKNDNLAHACKFFRFIFLLENSTRDLCCYLFVLAIANMILTKSKLLETWERGLRSNTRSQNFQQKCRSTLLIQKTASTHTLLMTTFLHSWIILYFVGTLVQIRLYATCN